MRVYLPTKSFSFFKVISGFIILALIVCFPVLAKYSFSLALIVGTSHVIGTWVSMYRANKLRWVYVIWIIFLSILLSFWGFKLSPSNSALLGTVTYMLFFMHLVYDEFDLQEEKRNFGNIISSMVPLFTLMMLFVRDFFGSDFNYSLFFIVIAMLLLVEFIYIKEINWFFIQTKLITAFVISFVFLGFGVGMIFSVLLILHYIFWFIYPVYKLHKHKREERDNLIMILLLIMSVSFYYVIVIFSAGKETTDLITKIFFITTIIHVLSTSPVGYLFGLPRSKYN